jgi:hypothetical protein
MRRHRKGIENAHYTVCESLYGGNRRYDADVTQAEAGHFGMYIIVASN